MDIQGLEEVAKPLNNLFEMAWTLKKKSAFLKIFNNKYYTQSGDVFVGVTFSPFENNFLSNKIK